MTYPQINHKTLQKQKSGFKATPAEVLRIWEKKADQWKLIAPPWRPSPADITIYRKLGGKRLRGHVLMLGATPELRDLIAISNQRHKPVIADISFRMLTSMSTLLKCAKPENEIWLKSNWCDMPLEEGRFDLIVGDMPWWVLSLAQQKRIRNKIVNLLKTKTGRFVARFRVRASERQRQNGAEVIKAYLAELKKSPSQKIKIRNALLSHLYDATADITAARMNIDRVRTLLQRAAQEAADNRDRTFIQEAQQYLIGADWTSQTQEELLAELSETFALVTECHAGDYDSAHYPIWEFMPKKR